MSGVLNLVLAQTTLLSEELSVGEQAAEFFSIVGQYPLDGVNGADADTAVNFVPDFAITQFDFNNSGGNHLFSTAESVFGGSSLLFNGMDSTNRGDRDPAGSHRWLINFFESDFSIEMFVRFTALASDQPFAAAWANADVNSQWLFYWDQSEGNMTFDYNIGGSPLVVDTPLTAPWSPVIDTWYHIVACRDDTVLRFFVDGNQIGTDQTFVPGPILPFDVFDPIEIGTNTSGLATSMDGYMDAARILKKAKYTEDFTPPTTFYPTVRPPYEDPNNTPQPLLTGSPAFIAVQCNFDGLDGATAYTSEDAGSRIATFVGASTLSDTQVRFGTTSLESFATTTTGVTFPVDSELGAGTKDFTAECWGYLKALPSLDGTFTEGYYMCGMWVSGSGSRDWGFGIDETDHLNLTVFPEGVNGTARGMTGDLPATGGSPAFGFQIERWYHLARSRRGRDA